MSLPIIRQSARLQSDFQGSHDVTAMTRLPPSLHSSCTEAMAFRMDIVRTSAPLYLLSCHTQPWQDIPACRDQPRLLRAGCRRAKGHGLEQYVCKGQAPPAARPPATCESGPEPAAQSVCNSATVRFLADHFKLPYTALCCRPCASRRGTAPGESP